VNWDASGAFHWICGKLFLDRVVVGQHLMQAASDLFLGWTRGDSGRDFYVRQLRDVKIKPVVEVSTRR
jgi:Uncharacterized protein conserved in bacteria (DUF2252)